MFITVKRRFAIKMQLHFSHNLRQLLGMNTFAPFVEIAANLVRCKAEHLLPAPAEEYFALRHVPIPEAIAGALNSKFPAGFALLQCHFCLLTHQDRSNVRGDIFQHFYRFESEAAFAFIVELNQSDNTILSPHRDQCDGGKTLMDAVVPRMLPRILIRWQVEQEKRVVGPAASPFGEQRAGSISLAG